MSQSHMLVKLKSEYGGRLRVNVSTASRSVSSSLLNSGNRGILDFYLTQRETTEDAENFKDKLF